MAPNSLSDGSVPAVAKPAPAPEKPYEPMVRGESAYDRVTAMLMSVVIGAALIVGWLWLIIYTNQAYAQKVPAKLEIVEVYGGGGGSPEGEAGATESVDVPGASAGAAASNNEAEDASNFEEPAVQETSSVVLDAMAAPMDDGSDGVEVSADMPRGGAIASGRRASKVGTGGIGLGPGGPGDGGVAREQRWVVVYPQGQSTEEYAKQLDSFGIELGVFEGSNTVVYASNFTGKPNRRTGLTGQDKRWYVTWIGRGRKQYDIELMQKAGIAVGDRSILQFYPSRVEETLSRLEVQYKGRQPIEIRQTRFRVVPQAGGAYTFAVLSQETLR